MPADSRDMPPVRLLPEAELARHALATPLFDRAARLARWAAPQVPVDAAAELLSEQLTRAAEELGLASDPEGEADAADAWAFAVDTGLVELDVEHEPAADAELPEPDVPAGAASPGKALVALDSGDPREILQLWLTGVEAVLAEAAALAAIALEEAGAEAAGETNWDLEEEEAVFLDGALGNLYLLTVLQQWDDDPETGEDGEEAVPLPVLAASLLAPDDAEGVEVPSDAMLEDVSEAMLRLDDHLRLLAPTGLVTYQPVDEALIVEDDDGEPPAEAAVAERFSEGLPPEEVSRYGMVRLTPLGVLAVRERLTQMGFTAPVIGDLADQDGAALLEALTGYPELAAYEEGGHWLAAREPVPAARELLAAARGRDADAPARRLAAQQALSGLGAEAEPALREVLDDRELGGLARVWLVEHGVSDVPPPDEAMVFWLTIDTIAAQLAVGDDEQVLRDLVRDLVARHDAFFDTAWRVDHPATADVLEAMGRLHPDRETAKVARKAAFKVRSGGSR